MDMKKNFLQQTIDKIEGLSFREKAENSGVSGSGRLNSLYNNRARPNLDEYIAIAHAADVDVNELITRYEAETNPNENKRRMWELSARFFGWGLLTLGMLLEPTQRANANTKPAAPVSMSQKYIADKFDSLYIVRFIRQIIRWSGTCSQPETIAG